MDKVMELAKAIKASSEDKNKTSAYETQAEVVYVDGNTAYVHIPDGVERTPATMIINAKKGDSVRVRISGGKAYVVGNVTSPPTDDSYAIKAEQQALRAEKAANAASADAERAQASADSAIEDATRANEAAESAIQDAGIARDAAESAQASAIAAAGDAARAKESADNASEYAARALGNLSTVQSVTETLNWITAHGTMTLTSDVALDPTHVYFVVDANGDYVVGNTHYSVVTEPNVADISTYYELSIDESLNNYVGTHLAVTSEGLWLLPDSGGNKVLIATGNGTTYTTAGTYIISGSDVLAEFTASGAVIGEETAGHASVTSNGLEVYAADAPTTPVLKATSTGLELGGNWTGLKMTGGTDSNGYAYGKIGLNDLTFNFADIQFGKNSVGEACVSLSSGFGEGAMLFLDSGYAAWMGWSTGLLAPTYTIRVGSSGISLDAPNIKMSLDTNAASGTDHDLYAAITALGWASDVITIV